MKSNLVERYVEFNNQCLANVSQQPITKSQEIACRFYRDYFQRVIDAPTKGEPTVFYNVYVPSEILYALDLVPYSIGCVAIKALVLWECSKFFDLAAEYGIPQDVCSWRRAELGMVLDDQFLPPNYILNSNIYCVAQTKLFEIFQNRWKVPTFCWDYPYRIRREGIDYYKHQMEDMIKFFEEHTGKKMDPARLKEVVELSKQACYYWEKMQRLREKAPCPADFMDSLAGYEMQIISLGTQDGVAFYKALYEEILDKYKRNEGAIPEERYRLAWWGVFPYHDLSFMNMISEDLKACIVADFFDPAMADMCSHILDISDPLEYIATRSFYNPILIYSGYHFDLRDLMIKVTKERSAEAAIVFAAYSCKQLVGLTGLFKDAMSRELGLPTLHLDGDHFDATLYSREQLVERVEGFFERIGGS
jgi:benzoyl-CoA reductase/2-hydroxyglutaryl-CoA dehydratase subunit BcrC/BadD/HgdB